MIFSHACGELEALGAVQREGDHPVRTDVALIGVGEHELVEEFVDVGAVTRLPTVCELDQLLGRHPGAPRPEG